MKLKRIIALCFLVVVFVGCKKAAGPGGKNTISGVITFKNGTSGTNDAAPMATVSIAYGTSESTTEFDQTILTDINGNYKIEGLKKGSYFIKAGYTDAHGFNYQHPGGSVVFNNKKKKAELNINLE